MNSGKSLELLKVVHNYEEQGKEVVVLKPVIDTRSEVNVVKSRTGFEKEAIVIYQDTNLHQLVENLLTKNRIYCVLVDESQFLSKEHVMQLTRIVDDLNVPVIAFGLKNDFRNELFEGTYHLLAQADKIEEIKTVCWYCDKKATMVIRFIDDKPTFDGDQIQIGGNESYKPVCRKCYHDTKNN
jgi:thymidine kinase